MRELRAEPSWRAVELLSDVHLSPAMPATFDAWAARLRGSEADALIVLGDLFEAWVGDDSRSDPFEARCLRVLADAVSRRAVFFMAGNRDFLLGEDALAVAGVRRLDDPTVLVAFDTRVLLTHGDALCLADTEYQRFRAEVRSPAWQREFLAKPLAERRRLASAMRDASAARQRTTPRSQYADVDAAAAIARLREADAALMIHGHTHRPASDTLAPGFTRHVLSDWDFEHGAQRGDVLRLSPGCVQRIAPLAAR